MIVTKINQLIITSTIETYFSVKELIYLIEARIVELDKNLGLTTEDIFDTVCLEYHLNADFLEKELSCKCPFALTGFLSELEQTEISDYVTLD
ncbi:hypothetical protein H6G33_26030 [Calothrix sp. FACHB-1219]|uniref:hypothetical protein n=1 Tax=unclassified Calothrix TaxID=2619626 RepID=UPI001682B675|nr:MULTISPECIES: hypothetical protein [unclassified Calothrix]MBD2205737.1 hypothetical protein [Calothrix sp. FACHB-168]MBD2220467.1 hypothetical protein [Calothrix sp. FACHB-1219]